MLHNLQTLIDYHIMKKGINREKDVFFAVIGIENRRINFSSQKIAEEVLRELGHRSLVDGEIELYCYCLMPNALHMLFSLSDSCEKDAGYWITTLKRKLSRTVNRLFNAKIEWKRKHRLEQVGDEDSFNSLMTMLLETPVREGLVSHIRDFKYSRFIKKP